MNNSYAITSTNLEQEMTNHYIVFELKGNHYAIDIHNVIEVINIPQIEVPQNTPIGVIGIFNYNGNMIKVVDLCPLIGFEPNTFTINNQLIIVCAEGVYYAVHTEKIVNIVQGEPAQIQPLPYNVSNSILKEVYKTEENMMVLAAKEYFIDYRSKLPKEINIIKEVTDDNNYKNRSLASNLGNI